MVDLSQVSWLLAAARFLHWGACLLLFGTLVFRVVIYAPVWEATGNSSQPTLSGRFRLLVIASFILVMFTGIFWFWAVASDMGGNSLSETLDPSVIGVVWNQTQVGAVCHWRVGIVLALALTLLAFRYDLSPRFRTVGVVLTLSLAGALLASLAWTGHGNLGQGWEQGAHLIADALHLCLAAIWPGGLIPLALFLGSLTSALTDLEQAKRVVARFSISSITCVVLLTITGTVNSLFLVGSIENLFATSYGRLLVLKLGLFVILIGCGAINLLYLSPRLTRSSRTITHLLRVVLIEIIVATLLIGAVAVLGLSQPNATG